MSYALRLGAITPQQATEQIFPAAKVRSTAGFNQAVRDVILAAATAGYLNAPLPSPCGSQSFAPGGDVKLISTASGLALTGVSIGLTATGAITAAALAPWTLGISALIGIFPMIFAHHAQAVAKENQTICASVPACNNALQVIMQAVTNGQATPQQAISALQSLQSDFASQVSSIIKDNSSQCNAACVWKESLAAVVLVLSSQLQDLASAPTASTATTAAVPSAVTVPAGSSGLATVAAPAASTDATIFGLPEWAVLAAAGVALFLVVR